MNFNDSELVSLHAHLVNDKSTSFLGCLFQSPCQVSRDVQEHDNEVTDN